MKNKILIISLIILSIIIIITVYTIYINRTFMLSEHSSIKQMLNADNIDIYIETVYPKETFKLSENDKASFIESLNGIKVKTTSDIINGFTRNFIIENNKNGKKITINITNSTVSVNKDNYNILNGSINSFGELYLKYTGKTHN